MGVTSKLNRQDISFLTNLITDITNELCECDCCKKEQGCSIFERVYIAGNLLYKKVTDDDFHITLEEDALNLDYIYDNGPIYIKHKINIFSDDSCIDWNTISQRINSNSSAKGKFVDKSRRKLLSRFYMYLYNQIGNDGITAEDGYIALTREIFGENADNVITNCLDECCN